jgi:hypothetical protein
VVAPPAPPTLTNFKFNRTIAETEREIGTSTSNLFKEFALCNKNYRLAADKAFFPKITHKYSFQYYPRFHFTLRPPYKNDSHHPGLHFDEESLKLGRND